MPLDLRRDTPDTPTAAAAGAFAWDNATDLIFEAVVKPHRSLSRRGVAIVLGGLGVVSLAVTTMFFLMGAWPIVGFNGGEVLLAAALLRAHARSRRTREVLLLTAQDLRILRFDENGTRTEKYLPAAWLNIILEDRPGRVPALYAATRGQRVELARVLGEPEKRDLAAALSQALHGMRHPRFDNPQLN